MKIQIIIGSTRQNRFSEKPARWLLEEAKKRSDFESELLDLRDYPLPFYDEPITPSQLKGRYSNETAKKWAAKIGEGDGFVIVTPEYNNGYPAVLKNALDYVFDEWGKKPVGFMSYGSVMGSRSVQQLRQVAIELRMVPLRDGLLIPPQVYRAVIGQKPDDTTDPFEPLRPFTVTFFDQLAYWAKALKEIRQHG